jgi:hypothetical protein
MAVRKKTLTVPAPPVIRLAERDLHLIRACYLANQDPDVIEIEKEFDRIPDGMTEPWN